MSGGKSSRPRRARTARIDWRVTLGSALEPRPGATIRMVVLGHDGDELFGIALPSGSLVRALMPRDAEEEDRVQRRRSPHLLTFTLGEELPTDPGRPELLSVADRPRLLGALRPRQLRRLLRRIVVSESPGALILGSRAASISYVALPPGGASLMLIALHPKSTTLVADEEGEVTLSYRWAKLDQRTEVHDLRARAAARGQMGTALSRETLRRALGFRPRYALIALTPVEDGYVRKVVIALLGR